MTTVIEAEQLSKRYGTYLAVDRVSFTVQAGEVMGLLGPNGSGKTTILRLLTGYLQPTSGRAVVAGFDVVTEGLEARRQVGYVPEDAPLYSAMRVEEFLLLMGRLKGLAGRALRCAVEVASERVGLQEMRHAMIGKLSRGYRQRTAIAQALLNEPPLLILDEPTNGLDPRQIIEMRALIRRLAATQTIVITSHILSEVEKVAQRVAILLQGRLLAVQALAEHPAEQHVQVTVRGVPYTRVQATLQEVPGVVEVSQGRAEAQDVATYRVCVREAAVTEALAAALVRRGFGVLALVPTTADLETLFLQLTQTETAV